VWLVLGLFYVRATLKKFTGMRYTMRDGGLHLLLVAKAFQQKKNVWRIATNPRVRTTLLGILVKAFYTPLMVGFFSGHANGIAEGWLRHKGLPSLQFVVPRGNA
ncbi:hypothetical protein, partial [Escherichia coli]|uniref:hypothetical protein n=1 Tax=Escherichia coli TaxID=562 RepID=UPI00159BC709